MNKGKKVKDLVSGLTTKKMGPLALLGTNQGQGAGIPRVREGTMACSCTTILCVFPSRKKPRLLGNFNFTTGCLIVRPLGNSGQAEITAATVRIMHFLRWQTLTLELFSGGVNVQ